MTLAIAAGGIDLSVGTAIDIASLIFVSAVAAHVAMPLAVLGGLAGGLLVGAFNAGLIAGLRITPFLATLGTLFIGQSVQQLSTSGGQPIYLITGHVPPVFAFIGHGTVLGIPFAMIVVGGCAAIFATILGRSLFGRRVEALGAQPGVAWYSGLRVSRDTAWVYLLGSLVCAIAGILLSCTVRAYVPLSGNAYLLNAIGATFLGTTFSRVGRPNVAGTLLGVLLLNIVANGLLLIGWNFYWQQVGSGVLIFLVLVVSFGGGRARSTRAA
jgi:ribose transport system permease protein